MLLVKKNTSYIHCYSHHHRHHRYHRHHHQRYNHQQSGLLEILQSIYIFCLHLVCRRSFVFAGDFFRCLIFVSIVVVVVVVISSVH